MVFQKYIITLLVLTTIFGMNGVLKGQESPYYQVSGTVRNDNYQPLDFVHVINRNLNKATVTDVNGRFSIVCLKSDTLLFSSMGFKKLSLTLPDSATSQFVFHDIYLEQDTFQIKEVMIFPWKTYSEFKKAFLALDLKDKDKENAKRNIELIKQQIVLNSDSDPGLGYKYTMNSFNNQTMNRGIPPINNLLNPLAWGRFIQSIKNGDFKDKNKELRKKNK